MTRKTSPRRTQPASTPSRDVLLAGIGAVSLGRKQALRSYATVVASACSLHGQALSALQDAGTQVKSLRDQAQANVAPLARKARALAERVRQQAQEQLQPVLSKLGVAARVAKPAARSKTSGKRRANTGARKAA